MMTMILLAFFIAMAFAAIIKLAAIIHDNHMEDILLKKYFDYCDEGGEMTFHQFVNHQKTTKQ